MGTLSSTLISDAAQSYLAMSITAQAIDLAVGSLDGSGSILSRRIELSDDTPDALENAVYENPLLLSDYGKVVILVDTANFMFLPSESVSPRLIQSTIDIFWHDDEYLELSSPVKGTPYTLLTAVGYKLLTFLRRTFPAASILNRMQPFVEYCVDCAMDSGDTKMYVNLRESSSDIVYMSGSRLMKCGTFVTPATTDILYYVTLMASVHAFDANTDEIVMCGNATIREKAMPALRKYYKYVVPEVSLSVRYDEAGIESTVPFELLCLPVMAR